MALGLLFAFSESISMIPNFLGAIAFLMAGIVLGNCIYRGLTSYQSGDGAGAGSECIITVEIQTKEKA